MNKCRRFKAKRRRQQRTEWRRFYAYLIRPETTRGILAMAPKCPWPVDVRPLDEMESDLARLNEFIASRVQSMVVLAQNP